MYQKERLDSIMSLLHRHGYVTVKFLSEELHYSTATINRDLNLLEQTKQVHRTWGGVEPTETQGVSLMFRYAKSKPAKKKIGKIAAQFVHPGDVIFVDGTTTTQYMGPYLAEIKNLTVITNNMALATYLSERSVNVIVLGGEVVEPPFMLDGDSTVDFASHYHADKCFLSAGSLSLDGKIGYWGMLRRIMIENSDQAFLLIDKEKINKKCHHTLCTLSEFQYLISDYEFDETTTGKYPNVTFLNINSKAENN